MIRPYRPVVALAVLVAAASVFGQAAPADDAVKAAVTRVRTAEAKFQKLFDPPQSIADPAVRQAKAGEGVPLLKEVVAGLDALVAAQPNMKDRVTGTRTSYEALLVVFGDAETQARLEAAAAGQGDDAATAKGTLLEAQWQLAEKDAAKQAAVVDQLEPLAKANPTSVPLTLLAYNASETAVAPASADRLRAVIGGMKNDAASQINEMIGAQAKLKHPEGKSLAIAGTTIDGKPFSTESMKGKVILVDFWATWCPPCVAEVPAIKKVYAEYHDKGLEVLGVSSDQTAAAVKKFAALEETPWPQLFDAEAAAARKWHPLTNEYGINGLPAMFLIDKKGIVRSVDAIENYKEMIPKLLAE